PGSPSAGVPRRASRMNTPRTYSRIDRLLIEAEHALASALIAQPAARTANPAADVPEAQLDDSARAHAAGLTRVNHVGEVCAQALYFGQAAVARDAATRKQLLAA